jgi:hypothetical protein
MSAKTRIYHVHDKAADKQHLVRAANRIQALNHVATNQFDVGIATQDQLLGAVAAGAAVVDAKPVDNDA